MTYRADRSYLKFRTHTKTTGKLRQADKAMDAVIAEDKYKWHLHDEPAVKPNQNVYDSLFD